MRSKLVNYFQAAFPCVALQTTEETRACADVVAAAKQISRNVITWSAVEGLADMAAGGRAIADTEDLMAACRQRIEQNTVYILRDPHTWPFERDPILLRSFREFIAGAPAAGSTVVIIAPEFKPHGTVANMVVVLDYDLPGPNELRAVCAGIAESAGTAIEATDEIIRALGGLTTTEAENALSLSIVEAGTFDARVIYREKTLAVKRTGLLDIVDPDPRGLDAVGGLDVLKAWISRRKRVWSPEAAAFGLPDPKGVLLVGVPGTGKSLSAKAFGTALNVPTLKLDVGSLFNSLVGESEARTRDALKLAEAMAPCVLWVDEIDKGLAGASGGGAGDGGVTRRVFGTIISWMQERRRPVFLVATANQVQDLPPELLRKGRFDELFAIDLPNVEERKEIFRIHLTKRGRKPEGFDVDALARAANDFTGSEIQAVLDEGLFSAFDADRELSTTDLLAAVEAIVPLAETAKEQIAAIRVWAKSRARFASSDVTTTSVAAPPVRSLKKLITTEGKEN